MLAETLFEVKVFEEIFPDFWFVPHFCAIGHQTGHSKLQCFAKYCATSVSRRTAVFVSICSMFWHLLAEHLLKSNLLFCERFLNLDMFSEFAALLHQKNGKNFPIKMFWRLNVSETQPWLSKVWSKKFFKKRMTINKISVIMSIWRLKKELRKLERPKRN